MCVRKLSEQTVKYQSRSKNYQQYSVNIKGNNNNNNDNSDYNDENSNNKVIYVVIILILISYKKRYNTNRLMQQ